MQRVKYMTVCLTRRISRVIATSIDGDFIKNGVAVSEFYYVEALMKLVQMLLHEKAFVMLYRKYCRCHRKKSRLGREFR